MPEVLHERRDGVYWMTINRPERANALNDGVVDSLAEGITRASADKAMRAIVITGAGERVFCAGGDLNPAADGAPFEVDPARPQNCTAALFRTMLASSLPIVARVNGHALAGGFGLMSYCHLAVASERARFGVPEVGVGLFPMMILPAMARAMPPRLLMKMCITGDPITAEEAFAAQLLNDVAPPERLDDCLEALLERIKANSPTGVRLGLQAHHAMRDMSMAQALDYAEIMLATMARTKDAREGFAAFSEKRKPDWTGV